ncbi:MAG TPA: iron-sulfur cluster assembly scaffold protein [Candidatus Xenobia bacterium]
MNTTSPLATGPFSAVVMNHFLHPRGVATLPNPDGEGWAGNTEAHRYMRIQVNLQDGVITNTAFGTYGCAPAIAAGSFVCEWALGKTVAEAQALTSEELTTMLGGLPQARRFCADLAVDALHAALLAAKPTASRSAAKPTASRFADKPTLSDRAAQPGPGRDPSDTG